MGDQYHDNKVDQDNEGDRDNECDHDDVGDDDEGDAQEMLWISREGRESRGKRRSEARWFYIFIMI